MPQTTGKVEKRTKTNIPIPEPRHRVGPKGVSSGISFRDLPQPSLDEIKKICEHYQEKCAGTYKSLASRYVYQMATEIEHLVDALKEGGYVSSEQGTLSTMEDDRDFNNFSVEVHNVPRSKKRSGGGPKRGCDKRNATSKSSTQHHRHYHHQESTRPRTAATNRKPSHSAYRRTTREFPFDCIDELSVDSPTRKPRQYHNSTNRHRGGEHRHHNVDSSLAHLNLEDQNEEVLRWLREEMKRSQSLINRSKQLHDAELVNAKKEVEKVKKAAKLLIKAVHKKEKEKAAKLEANAECERRQRKKSQKMIENLIQSHSSQIGLLKKGLRRHHHYHGSSRDVDELRDQMGRFYPFGELYDDTTDVSFSLSDASDDMTSVLDSLAEEAYSAKLP